MYMYSVSKIHLRRVKPNQMNGGPRESLSNGPTPIYRTLHARGKQAVQLGILGKTAVTGVNEGRRSKPRRCRADHTKALSGTPTLTRSLFSRPRTRRRDAFQLIHGRFENMTTTRARAPRIPHRRRARATRVASGRGRRTFANAPRTHTRGPHAPSFALHRHCTTQRQ